MTGCGNREGDVNEGMGGTRQGGGTGCGRGGQDKRRGYLGTLPEWLELRDGMKGGKM